MPSTSNNRYRAHAAVQFEKINDYIEPIVESIATHDMTVKTAGGIHHIHSPFGDATFEATANGFRLTAEAPDPGGLNRLKHALVGPIGFIAARENLDIQWEGDHADPAFPDDLRILRVQTIEDLAPRFRRIVFKGENLERYDRKDQLHCRLIFQPRDIAAPRWPLLDHRGHVVWQDNIAVPTRVYTIRFIDTARQTITIDFALHAHPGPATLGDECTGRRCRRYSGAGGERPGAGGLLRSRRRRDRIARHCQNSRISAGDGSRPCLY
ncbi:DUF2218 domain-containing protein [Rhizobium sp. AU243]|uniref:DUF2218 domain-containing protein n=1 Tax=Rhizobium sp. AU243 TaxID=2303425 RepID=UPI0025701C69|nr:DUF2218 domain-containing protein [Rhizobium sp. AU243]